MRPEEVLGALGVARAHRRDQLLVLGGDLRGALVVLPELREAEEDLGLHRGVGAGKPWRSGRVDDRAVEPEVGLDDRAPRSVVGNAGELGHGLLGGGGYLAACDHQADGLDLERGPQPEDVDQVRGVEGGHLHAAVGLAEQEALGDQDLGCRAEGVAGDAKAPGELGLAKPGTRLDLAVQDHLAKCVGRRLDGRDGCELKGLRRLLMRGCGEESVLAICHIIPQSDKMRQVTRQREEFLSVMSGVERGRIAELMEREQSRFSEAHPESRKLHERGKESLLDGVPMNWMTRWPGAFPVFVASAQGADVSDVDGNEYADLCLGDTGAMTGHSPPATVAAVQERVAKGITAMLPTEDAVHVGEEMKRRFGMPNWQFSLSATDANRFVVRISREITGRPKILVHNHCYHGSVDETIVTLVDGEVQLREGNVGAPGGPGGDHADRRDQRPRSARARARRTGTSRASWSSPP